MTTDVYRGSGMVRRIVIACACGRRWSLEDNPVSLAVAQRLADAVAAHRCLDPDAHVVRIEALDVTNFVLERESEAAP